jgi:Na+(H+)/acetate symporter ActP
VPEPFSSDDFQQAGQQVLTVFEALEDEDVQADYMAAAEALGRIATNLRAHGLPDRIVALSLVGLLIAPILPPENADA